MVKLNNLRLSLKKCLIYAFFSTHIISFAGEDPNVSPGKNITVDYYRSPFNNISLWKSRPVSPSFSNFTIPTSKYNPNIHEGTYSSGCFFADDTNQQQVVIPNIGQKGIYDADSETYQPQITIPHWPEDLKPATGSDGHADIYDVSNGVIHSFWRLKNTNGEWSANLYAWAPINGSGWGDPAHYYQGGRATGVGACAGIIRKHEFASSDSIYPHALAMSLDQSGAAPGYVFPATSSDHYSNTNTGQIPEGALVMLPRNFDVSAIKTPELIKIANTLKVYGAYIVDGNFGTPFVIYAENGSGLNLHKNGYSMKAVYDLNLIRESLRMVTSARYWVNASGNPFVPEKNLNILSMRGPWGIKQGTIYNKTDPLIGKFDTWKQAVVFGPTKAAIVQSNTSNRSISQVTWAKPIAGETFKLTALTSGGGKLRLIIYDKEWRMRLDTYDLSNGQSRTFTWPMGELYFNLTATSGIGASSTVSGSLIRVK